MKKSSQKIRGSGALSPTGSVASVATRKNFLSRKSISKTIRGPLKNVSSKLVMASFKRGKKSSSKSKPKRQTPSLYSKCDSFESGQTSPSSANTKNVLESMGTPNVNVSYLEGVAKDTNRFISLEPKKGIDTNTRLTPLEFDTAQVINHFRSEESGSLPTSPSAVHSRKEDFSLHQVLNNCSMESEEGHKSFLKVVDATSNSAFEACKPPSMPDLEDQEGCRSRADSNYSIPSLSADMPISTDEFLASAQVPHDVTNTDEAADSVLAWGCLTALLGAPVPQSVPVESHKKKKRTPVNLWQDDEVMDFDDVISLPQDIDPEASIQKPPSLSEEESNRRKFDRVLKKAMKKTKKGKGSTFNNFYDPHYLPNREHGSSMRCTTSSSDIASLSSERAMPPTTSNQSILSLCPEMRELFDSDKVGSTEIAVCEPSSRGDDYFDMQVDQDATNADQTADSALVWGCLSAILGAPAPRSVLCGEKKHKKRLPVNLWLGDDESDDVDEIISLPMDDTPSLEGLEEVSDHCSIPSLSPGETHFDEGFVPDRYDAANLAFPATASITPKTSKKDIADSTLVWSALAAVLGSPAPSSAIRKKALKDRNNLWEDGEADLLPEIDELEVIYSGGDESDSIGLPSIDLNELEDSNGDAEFCYDEFVDNKVGKKLSADSALAWGALGMLLGSPAPKLVNKKTNKASVENLWEENRATENEESDTVPSIHRDDADSIPSPLSEDHDENTIPGVIELSSVNAFDNSLKNVTDKKEVANSAIAWSAVAALLGSPAPSSIPGKKRKADKGSRSNLWDDGNAIMEDLDDLSLSQSDSSGEDGNEVNAQNVPQAAHDNTYIASVEPDVSDDDFDAHSIPSLSGLHDNETGSSSPLTICDSHSSSFDGSISTMKRVSSSKGLADTALAWGALAACLGAPKAALRPKRKKEVQNLWGVEHVSTACEITDLTLMLQDCE